MRSLVVYESIYGNTARVAQAIAEALRARGEATAVEVGGAPQDLQGYDLIVVGGPIHAWGMTSAMTRKGARDEAERAGVRPVSAGPGVREWLAALPRAAPGQAAAAFDTAMHAPIDVLHGSAAGPEARRLEALGFHVLAAPEHFYVVDKDGPLVDGELDRARRWAGELGRTPNPVAAAPGPALPRRGLLLGLSAFAALSAFGGGAEMLLWPGGTPYVPLALLEPTVFRSFLIPGLLLGGVVGGTSAASAVLAWRRSPAALDAALLAGGAMTVWIAAEVAQMRTFSGLQAIYGGRGLAILGLGMAGGWSAGPRLRWIIAVTLGEALGFLVPVAAGVATAASDLGEGAQGLALIGAGLVEGLLLGAGQALAMPLPVHRGRYMRYSALGAGLAWACALGIRGLFLLDGIPGAAAAVGAVCLAAVALVGLGGAQALELRRHGVPAARWMGWTALAWILALPLSFLPAPLVDAQTPAAASAVLWACAGLLMAHVMARVTWRGVARCGARTGEGRPTPSTSGS